MITQYSKIEGEGNNIINGKTNNKIQNYNNTFIQNWSLQKFNTLPLIQRITIINQTNRIIQAFRNYLKTKGVRNKYNNILTFRQILIYIPIQVNLLMMVIQHIKIID